jgi:hypothetical protein
MTIDVPASAFVPCPQIGFKNRKASKCLECPHFQGLVDTNEKAPASMPFDQRYRIGCAHVIARRMTSIEVE